MLPAVLATVIVFASLSALSCGEVPPFGPTVTGIQGESNADRSGEPAVRARKVKRALISLSLAPESAELHPGETLQFTVSGGWSDGSTDEPAVSWSAQAGSITKSGLYSAPSFAGTFRVIARQSPGGSLADTSIVVVAAEQPPEPPDPPPPPAGANECDALRAEWIWCDDFEQNRMAGYFEVVDAGGAYVRASGVGHAESWGMKAHFAAGTVSAGSLKLAFGRTPQAYVRPVDAGTANYRELYWRLYLRNAPGWTGGGGDKLSRMTILASSSWAQAMIAHVWSGGAGNNHLILDPASGTDVQGALRTTTYNDFPNLRWLGQAHSSTPIFASANVGVWYCIESHVRLNDAGQSNGVFEMWINGALEAQRTGMNWVGDYSAYGLNALFLENFWNAGSPAAQDRYMDRLVVSTERIGC